MQNLPNPAVWSRGSVTAVDSKDSQSKIWLSIRDCSLQRPKKLLAGEISLDIPAHRSLFSLSLSLSSHCLSSLSLFFFLFFTFIFFFFLVTIASPPTAPFWVRSLLVRLLSLAPSGPDCPISGHFGRKSTLANLVEQKSSGFLSNFFDFGCYIIKGSCYFDPFRGLV